jgi:hypothetical protein
MTEETPPTYLTDKIPTVKFRVLDPEFDGNSVDFFLYASTTDEEIYNLLDRAKRAGQIARELEFSSANMIAGRKAMEDKKLNEHGFKLRYDTNKLFHVVSIDIIPKPGGVSQVHYYGDSFKQPRDDYFTVSSFGDPKKLQEILAPYYKFKEETFRTAETFAVDFYAEWYESNKINSQGNPYKNLSQIHVAEGAVPPARMEAPPPPEPKPEQPPEIEPTAPPPPDDIPF